MVSLPLVHADSRKERKLLGEALRLQIDAVRSLEEAADSAKDAGDYAKAFELYQQGLRLTEANLGTRHPDIIHLKVLLAGALRAAGDPAQALRLAKEANQLASTQLEPGHPFTASALNEIGLALLDIGRHDEALTAFQAVLSGAGSPSPLSRLMRAAADTNIGNVLTKAGRHTEALDHINAAQSAVEELYGPDDIDLATILSLRSVVLVELGDLEQASRAIESSLAIQRKQLSPGHPDFVFTLNNAANIYTSLGSPDKALPLLIDALSIGEEKFGRNHLHVASIYSNICKVYSYLGSYSNALHAANEALTIRERVLGANASQVADTLLDLAGLSINHLHDPSTAIGLLRRAIAIYSASDNVDLKMKVHAQALAASCLYQLGKPEESIKVLSAALAMATDADLAENISLGIGEDLAILLEIHQQIGLDPLEKIIARKREILGNGHPELCLPLASLADLLARRGRIPQSRSSLMEAVAIARKRFQGYHPIKREVIRDLAEALTADGAFAAGQTLASGVLGLTRLHVFEQAQYLGTSQTGQLSLQLRRDLDLLASLVSSAPAPARSAGSPRLAAELAATKGLIQEAEASHARLNQDPDDDLRTLLEEFRRCEAALDFLEQEATNPTDRAERRQVLIAKGASLRRQLDTRLERFLKATNWLALTPEALARAIPTNTALIDFFGYHPGSSISNRMVWENPRYGAMVSFPLQPTQTNAPAVWVDLGESRVIQEAIAELENLLETRRLAPSRLNPVLSRISSLIYAPLATHVASVPHLIICPEGPIGRVPFEMLPQGSSGRYLLEGKRVSYLNSGRELLQVLGRTAVTKLGPALVLGAPNFDARPAEPASEGDSPPLRSGRRMTRQQRTRTLSTTLRDLRFSSLPDAELEAKEAAKLLGDDVVLLTGSRANRWALEAASSPKVLHIASHGFYAPDQPLPEAADSLTMLRAGADRHFGRLNRQVQLENPLIRCGIALAGANVMDTPATEASSIGLLSGLDATTLRLAGTRLVILSTCESGKGDLQPIEGMQSLRRAFTIAGAESVLASHWKISDEASRRLIVEFLRNWNSGESRLESLRKAQLSLLTSKEFSSPYFWAAFTLTGDWR